MNAFPYIIWGLTCLAAAVGTVLVFRSEDRETIGRQRAEIRSLTSEVDHLNGQLLRTRARLSQLVPVPEDIVDRIRDHESSKVNEVYDQATDRGPTQVLDPFERRSTQRGWDE